MSKCKLAVAPLQYLMMRSYRGNTVCNFPQYGDSVFTELQKDTGQNEKERRKMIQYTETLELIADCHKEGFDKEDFARELGVPSDTVGWMRLDVNRDMDTLKRISSHARANGVKLRGTYKKTAILSSAEWYLFSPRNGFSMSDYSYAQKYGDYYYDKVRAYKAPKGCNLIGNLVSQTFVDKYRELGLTGLDFIWQPDSGKYHADTFYIPIFLEKAKRCIYPGNIESAKKLTYDTLTLAPIEGKYDFSMAAAYYRQADFPEGRLCEVEKYMDNLDVVLPLALEYNSMPDTDFAYCAWKGFCMLSLIRETALQKMVDAGVVHKEDFTPVMCTNEKEQSLLIDMCVEDKEIPIMLKSKAHFEKLRLALAAKERPIFVPSEKEVLSLLRKYKKNHPDFLNRAISKTIAENVSHTPYAPLLPYYRIGCAGRLAEYAYEYFYYETAVKENDAYHQKLAARPAENNMDSKHETLLNESVLFGKSADDNYLLLHEGQVYEVSCYDYRIVKHWDCIYLFFYEQIEG